MFGTLKTLFIGASARAEDAVRDTYAIELIDQKIREVDASLAAAKATLASLIQRQRSEQKLADALTGRIATMTTRVSEALEAGNETIAAEGAEAIATMENELALRRETLDRLEQKVIRLRSSVEAGHRRLIDLKQGAISARAVRREQDIQMRMVRAGGSTDAVTEAQSLIDRVLGADDPFEKAQIVQQIDRELSHGGVEQRLSDAGFGPATRVTASAVLDRLKAAKQ